jgi:hypothetical protein
MTNNPEKTNFAYERYIANQFRYHFGFEGSPLNFIRFNAGKKMILNFPGFFTSIITSRRFFLPPNEIQRRAFKAKMIAELIGNVTLVSKICFFRIVRHKNKSRRRYTYLVSIVDFGWATRF